MVDQSKTTIQLRVSRIGASTPAVADIELPPEFLQAYTPGRVLGSGAMGMVVQATSVKTRQVVAVKFLLEQTPELLERFLREGRLLSQVRHPNVMWVHEVGNIAGHPFLVTECLEGGNLRELLGRGRVDAPRAQAILVDALKGLAALHRAGIVHRDIKPENILFTKDGQAKIADLGIARDGEGASITKTGAIIGTPLYMSPEQLMGEQAGPQADLYAMGLIGYELFAGEHPFLTNNFADLLESQMHRQPPPLATKVPGIASPLADAIHRALAKSPRSRPASAEEMAEQVRGTSAAPVPAAHTPPAPRLRERASSGNVALNRTPAGPSAAAATVVLNVPAGAAPTRVPARGLKVGAVSFLVVLVLGYWLAVHATFWRPEPKLLEQTREVESTQAVIDWKTAPTCFSQVEYWQATSTTNRLRTPRPSIMHNEHRHTLRDLKPLTTYHFRFIFAYSAEERADDPVSAVFDLTTRPKIQVFNVHVDEYATKAIVTWETAIRTDTTLKYGLTDQYDDLRTNPEQKSETIHSMTIEGLKPDTTYHYQVLASDLRGRARPTPSEDMMFRTSKEDTLGDTQGRENAGLVNLTKSYVDKLTRMGPLEREDLRTSTMKFTDPLTELSPAEKKQLLASRTDPENRNEFESRVQMSRRWMHSLKATGKPVDKFALEARLLVTLYYTNHKQAARKLDRYLKELDAIDK